MKMPAPYYLFWAGIVAVTLTANYLGLRYIAKNIAGRCCCRRQ